MGKEKLDIVELNAVLEVALKLVNSKILILIAKWYV